MCEHDRRAAAVAGAVSLASEGGAARAGLPYWIDDPEFDLEYHVRELALAPPPTNAKLAEQVARIFARPLDRARPLWELYLIYGLSDGNVGLLTKFHHAAVDGMSGAEIMGVLLDLSPEGREPPPA